jgi:hypothetical protein
LIFTKLSTILTPILKISLKIHLTLKLNFNGTITIFVHGNFSKKLLNLIFLCERAHDKNWNFTSFHNHPHCSCLTHEYHFSLQRLKMMKLIFRIPSWIYHFHDIAAKMSFIMALCECVCGFGIFLFNFNVPSRVWENFSTLYPCTHGSLVCKHVLMAV